MGLIFDIGANVGNFASTWLRTYSDCKIVCVEANQNLIPILKGLFNGNDNIHVINKLVSDRAGESVNFYINANHTLSTASEFWKNEGRFKDRFINVDIVSVETITLDDLVKQYGEPDFIKIDVEGYELEVLRGLTKAQKGISFEFVEENMSKMVECCKYLMTLGYNSFGYILRDDWIEFPKKYCAFHELDIWSKVNLLGATKLWGNIYTR